VLAEQGGFIEDATKIISEPMDEFSGREYPGGRPFAEPGMSISNIGPCGQGYANYDNDTPMTNW
jgi:hypothetical protein